MRRIVLVLLGLAALAAAYQGDKDLSVINARINYDHKMVLTIRNDGTADTTAKVAFRKFPHADPLAVGGLYREKLVEVPADTTLDVTFHGKVNLREFCNLFMATIECSSGSMAQELTPEDNMLVFRICKRSDGSKGSAQMIPCDGLEHLLDEPLEYGRKCARRAFKECKVECCREEAHVVETPQCCLQAMNFTESVTYLDEFEVVAYDNSDGSALWGGMPWTEGSFEGLSPANLDDGEPDQGRMRVENGELALTCGDSTSCDLGCLVAEPMYIHRPVEVPSCLAETSTLRIGARYTALSDGAVLSVFKLDKTLLASYPLPATGGQAGSIDVELEVDFDYELVMVEIMVPVTSCSAVTDVRVGILQVKHTCDVDNIECPQSVVRFCVCVFVSPLFPSSTHLLSLFTGRLRYMRRVAHQP